MSRHEHARAANGAVEVLRSPTEKYAGLIVGWGLLLIFWGLDPLGIYRTADEGVTQRDILIFPLLSIFAVVVGVHSQIDLHADTVVVRNPLRHVVVPLARLSEVDASGGSLRLCAGGRWYSAHGVIKSPAGVLTRHQGRSDRIGKLLLERASLANMDDHRAVRVHWRRPEWHEYVLLFGWIAFFAASVFLGA